MSMLNSLQDTSIESHTPAGIVVCDQIGDIMWRMNNLYYCVNEQGNKVLFKPNDAQAALILDLWWRNDIVKARQLGFCLDPSTRVLTADCKWIAIKDIKVGTKIICVDEHSQSQGKARRMHTGSVDGVVYVERDSYRISFEDGRSVVCSSKHPWLARREKSTDYRWLSVEPKPGKRRHLEVGMKIRSLTDPWSSKEPTYEDGWFGGMLDGEGSISKRNTSAGINVSQLEGPVWDRMIKYCEDNGYNHCIEADNHPERKSKFGSRPVPKIKFGRMDEMFRLIGTTRPTKYLSNHFWEGREIPGCRSNKVSCATISKIEHLGTRKLVDLQTSHGTYIAEGLVSHNTTFISILGLDFALFNSNKTVGFIAHKGDAAINIYQKKILFPYDNLPENIKKARDTEIRQDSGGHITFDNGSSINVGLSFRSDTCQFLHISEFGKICARYPARAEEIITGSIPTVHKGGRVFIESTTEGAYGYFYDISSLAYKKQLRGDKLTYLDFKLHFFPWWQDARYELAEKEAKLVVITEKETEYFDNLEVKIGRKLNIGRRAWHVATKATLQGKMNQEYPSTFEEAFQTIIKGAYYKNQLDKAYAEGRIGDYPHVPDVPVHTFWDLGIGDEQAIWGVQLVGGVFRFVFYYQASGEDLKHYIDILKETGYEFAEHWAPHDIAVREWSSAQSRIEIAAEKYGIRFYTAPKLSIADGIDAVRRVFKNCVFHEKAVKDGINALSNYQKQYDEKRGCYRNIPLHNSASNGADAFRYFAVTKGGMAEKMDAPTEPTPPSDDDIWANVGV